MRVLAHLVLLVLSCGLAWGLGLVGAAVIAAGAGASCVALRGIGAHWVRAVAFLGAVGAVVACGLRVEQFGYMVLAVAALLVVQIAAVGAVLALKDDDEGGAAMPTLAFYGALAGAYFLLSGAPESWGIDVRIAAAAGLIVAGLLVWRMGAAVRRFRKTDPVGKRRRLPAAVGFVLLLVILGGALYKPLPWAGERVIEAGAGLRSFAGEIVARWKGGGIDESAKANDGAGAGDGAADPDFGRRRELPKRAELNQGSEALLHVQIPDRAEFGAYVVQRNYVRSWVLEQYSDGAWEEPEAEGLYREDIDDGANDGWVRLAPGRGIEHRIYLPAGGGAGLPAIQNPLGFRLEFLVESAPDMYEAELRGAVYYDAESLPRLLSGADVERADPGRAPRGHLIALAGGVLGQRLAATARDITQGAQTPGQRLAAIRQFLHTNCRYASRIENPQGLPALENFLYGERVGWCDFFASASVLLAREAGFPARMAYGFSGGQAFVSKQLVSYREKDAHAWAEVFVDGVGWVVFDTTPDGSGAARAPEDGGRSRAPELDAYRPAEEGGDANAGMVRRSLFPEWARWGALGLLLLGLLGYIVLRILANRDDEAGDRHASDSDRSDPNAPAYWREFLRLCREFGRAMPKGETLLEAVSALREAGLEGEVLPGLVDYHYGVRYEGSEPDRGREGELRRELKRLRKGIAV